ncbi:MAG TPA: extensin family protein, partial [Beijerinckiaceae bacterium]|nr:extensin family protein [Beijerinckiaceae bacterium]
MSPPGPPPPAKPVEANPPATPPPAKPAEANSSPPSESDCLASLRTMGWDFEALPSADHGTQCKIDTPIQLKNLRIDGTASHAIAFPDKPTVACRFAMRFGQWIGDLAEPLTMGRLGTDFKAIETGPGFECRTMDSLPHAKMSAHSMGIAVDIGAFDLANGKRVAVTESADAQAVRLLSALRTSACGWFTTILGPGTDPYHKT